LKKEDEIKTTLQKSRDELARALTEIKPGVEPSPKQLAGVVQLQSTSVDGHELVLKDPPITVLFEDFADSALTFTIYFFLELISVRDNRAIVSEIRHRVSEALARAGMAIAFPQRDVHIDAKSSRLTLMISISFFPKPLKEMKNLGRHNSITEYSCSSKSIRSTRFRNSSPRPVSSLIVSAA
jgi:hypothetical protein